MNPGNLPIFNVFAKTIVLLKKYTQVVKINQKDGEDYDGVKTKAKKLRLNFSTCTNCDRVPLNIIVSLIIVAV